MKSKCITGLLALGFILYLSSVTFAQKINEVKTEFGKFIEDYKQIYRLDDDTKHQMWEALCGRMDAENIYDIQRCQEVVKEFQERELQSINNALNEASKISRNIEELRNDPTANRNDVDKLRSDLNAEIDRLTKLQGSGALKGSNNPFVQYAIEYGKKMHVDLQNSMGQQPKICEKSFADKVRPDLVFIDGDGLWIYEFKPNTAEQISKGEKQLSEDYKPIVEGYFNDLFSKGRKGEVGNNSSNLGGDDFIKALKACDKCWSSDGNAVIVRTKVVTYPPCEEKF